MYQEVEIVVMRSSVPFHDCDASISLSQAQTSANL